jgi:hypothetical protein
MTTKSEEFYLVRILLYCVFSFAIFLFFVAIYDTTKKRATFQQTYNKNLECRQALKAHPVGRIDEICGQVPQIKDFID